jgi:hypothetical protein
MIIQLFVVFCLTQNPYMCRTLEMVPQDLHAITSVAECTKGGAVGGMRFTLEHMEWRVKGWRCVEKPNLVSQWIGARN